MVTTSNRWRHPLPYCAAAWPDAITASQSWMTFGMVTCLQVESWANRINSWKMYPTSLSPPLQRGRRDWAWADWEQATEHVTGMGWVESDSQRVLLDRHGTQGALLAGRWWLTSFFPFPGSQCVSGLHLGSSVAHMRIEGTRCTHAGQSACILLYVICRHVHTQNHQSCIMPTCILSTHTVYTHMYVHTHTGYTHMHIKTCTVHDQTKSP